MRVTRFRLQPEHARIYSLTYRALLMQYLYGEAGQLYGVDDDNLSDFFDFAELIRDSRTLRISTRFHLNVCLSGIV